MHRIERQTVELSVATRAGAAGLQERLAAALRGDGAAALGRGFDRATGERRVRIERMELDLGTLRGPDWLEAFIDRLAEAAALAIEAPQGTPAEPAAGHAGSVTARAEGLRVAGGRGDAAEELVIYLATGRLPWWSTPGRTAGWVAHAVAGLAAPERRRVIALVAAGEALRERLVLHLPDASVEALIEESVPAGLRGHLAAIAREMAAPASLPNAARRAWRMAYWHPLIRLSAGGWPKDAADQLSSEWVKSVEQIAPDMLASFARAASGAPSLPAPWRAALTGALAAAMARRGTGQAVADPDDTDRRPVTASSAADALQPFPETKADHSGVGTRRLADSRPSRTEKAVEDADPIPVTGAGIVLLHPFLEELFARFGLLAGRRFADEAAQCRAVHLLGYLADGTPEPQEPDLVLAKLMCAMPLEAVLVPTVLSPAETEAADALLTAVMTHWTALRTGSADWLRDQFLRRDGTLRRLDAGWGLTVETRAQDVLLARLPWGIGTIMLPWDALLHVKWRD